MLSNSHCVIYNHSYLNVYYKCQHGFTEIYYKNLDIPVTVNIKTLTPKCHKQIFEKWKKAYLDERISITILHRRKAQSKRTGLFFLKMFLSSQMAPQNSPCHLQRIHGIGLVIKKHQVFVYIIFEVLNNVPVDIITGTEKKD